MTPAVDVDRVARWAGRWAAPGPVADRTELEREVAGLRDAAERALPIARRAGRFGDALPAEVAPARVLVVDRAGWARVAAGSFAALLGPASPATSAPSGPAWPVTVELAGLLALLSRRVLGQFDPYGSDDAGGRLALVAPNVREAGAAMGADPADLRLWICVHEQTHALQFAAAPWLAGHVRAEVAALQGELEEAGELAALLQAVRSLPRRRPSVDDGLGPLGALLRPEQRERAGRLVAAMSLLEGHADVTMDDVPPGLVPSRRRLRARMTARRAAGQGSLLRRLLGLDAKIDQYRRGADFVRAVRRTRHDALDRVWSGPDALPGPEEIEEPGLWVRRMATP